MAKSLISEMVTSAGYAGNGGTAEACVHIICADLALAREYCTQFERSGERYFSPMAQSPAEACLNFQKAAPAVILFDESAARSAGCQTSLESTVSSLTEVSPVVVVATMQRQDDLSFLITSGAVDFVGRAGDFVSVAVGLAERRIRLANHSLGVQPYDTPGEEFAELLRHEVNNPLTGILGNAELLLLRREYLSPAVVARIETIADLAVRLRETVRRLSYACSVRKIGTEIMGLHAAPQMRRVRRGAPSTEIS